MHGLFTVFCFIFKIDFTFRISSVDTCKFLGERNVLCVPNCIGLTSNACPTADRLWLENPGCG